MGLSEPTRVQASSLPTLLSGTSAFLKSETGSGKTLAYLLPILHRLQDIPQRSNRDDGTLALILAPTRELCIQIFDVLLKLVKPFIWLVPGCVYGGERRKSEKARLRKGVSILVATPGRLVDHLKNTESFKWMNLRAIVLDELDR